jgi:hypothetical protein
MLERDIIWCTWCLDTRMDVDGMDVHMDKMREGREWMDHETHKNNTNP